MFSRTERVIGKDNLEKLKNICIAVLGVGGVGGYVAEMLARIGVQKIILVDYDRIDISNINRQIIATTLNIGEYKVDAFKKRILDINPNCKVFVSKEKINKDNISKIFTNLYLLNCKNDTDNSLKGNLKGIESYLGNLNYHIKNSTKRMKLKYIDTSTNKNISISTSKKLKTDLNETDFLNLKNFKIDYVIDAIDDVNAKVEIAKYCKHNNLKLISSMGTGNRYKMPKFEVTDIFKTSYDRLAKKMRRLLKDNNINSLTVVWTKEEASIIENTQSDLINCSVVKNNKTYKLGALKQNLKDKNQYKKYKAICLKDKNNFEYRYFCNLKNGSNKITNYCLERDNLKNEIKAFTKLGSMVYYPLMCAGTIVSYVVQEIIKS